MNTKYADLLIRAAKTFIQSFLAVWALTQYDFEKGAIVGAVAAGISAVMNLAIPPANTSPNTNLPPNE